jgi:hypothetical protein
MTIGTCIERAYEIGTPISRVSAWAISSWRRV